MLGFGLAVRLLFLPRRQLAFRKHDSFLRHPGLKRLQPPLEGGQIVPQPNAANSSGGDEHAALAKLVAHAKLPAGGLLEREVQHRLFHSRVDAVLHVRLLTADLLQRSLAAGVVQGFEPVETVSGVAHYLARLGHVPKLPCKFQDSDFRLDDFMLVCHSLFLV